MKMLRRGCPTSVSPLLLAALLYGCADDSGNAGMFGAGDPGGQTSPSNPLDASGPSLDGAAQPFDAHAQAADGGPGSDAGPSRAAALEQQARAIAATASDQFSCARVAHATPVADLGQARAAAHTLVASALGLALDAVELDVSYACRDPATGGCANIFDKHGRSFGGGLAAQLWPLAQQLEATASAGEHTLWDKQDSAVAACISGVLDGELVGICVMAGASCMQ